MYQYTDVARGQFIMADQFVPDVKYVADIKLESEMESYYSMGINLASVKFTKENHLSSFLSLPDASSQMMGNLNSPSFVENPFESSDGECSPKSLDENDLLDSMLGSGSPCVKGIKTITRNPRRNNNKRSDGKKCGKIIRSSNRTRKSTESIPPKEKDRARLFNEAFDGLRKRIPSIPATKKLSKIEILRLAICYMSYLKFRLEDNIPKLETHQNINEEENRQHQTPIGELGDCSNMETNSRTTTCQLPESSNNDVIILSSG